MFINFSFLLRVIKKNLTGFELIGSKMRLCKEDGTFSGSEAYCKSMFKNVHILKFFKLY